MSDPTPEAVAQADTAINEWCIYLDEFEAGYELSARSLDRLIQIVAQVLTEREREIERLQGALEVQKNAFWAERDLRNAAEEALAERERAVCEDIALSFLDGSLYQGTEIRHMLHARAAALGGPND